jgi:hypothetical protein
MITCKCFILVGLHQFPSYFPCEVLLQLLVAVNSCSELLSVDFLIIFVKFLWFLYICIYDVVYVHIIWNFVLYVSEAIVHAKISILFVQLSWWCYLYVSVSLLYALLSCIVCDS